MEAVAIHTYARKLIEVRGNQALADAAQRALALERQGEKEQAETWRRIEAAVRMMRGPKMS
jgi:hypothetical protein